MQDNKDKRPCKKLKVNFTYKKPTDDELRNLIDSSRCKNTDYSTSNWIRALEKFRTDVNYQGLIEKVDTKEELEDQLCRFVNAMRKKDGSEYHVSSVNSCMFEINKHLNNKSVISKPINIMDKDQYYKLWQILNGKVKSLVSQGRGERNGADGFTEDDLLQILDHPAMSGNDPASLLYRIFFFNAIFLGLRGGEHFNLQLQNFIRRKDKYGGFDVIIYKSKTNQHGANNIESQGDKLYIPEIPSIIEMYENYFTKRPTQADPHFYLKPCNISEVEFNGQWYHKQHVSEKEIKSFMKKIVTLTGINDFQILNVWASTRHKSEQGLARYERPETEIQRNNAFNLVEAFGFNKNNIRSEESMEQSTLSTDNFVVAKSLLNDNREVINSANSNIKVTRRPLKDLNEIQENKSQNLEELVSKLTADKDFGGSSALQQGILAFLSVLKGRLVCNFLLTWDFDGRSLKGEFPSAFDFGLECQVPPSGFNLGFLLQVLSSVELWMQKRILENLLDRVPVTGKL
ncbi:hypothetical protein GLOIN_2v1768727 [Rhizophagus irregularis DAOM 181602=DAOM 197198]|uniref:ZMYM2-like/QRICH1 C-terminal domain-containing protein n=2 Tax=Rhizophagus irregularis (strain DAOM 181602 / DAOM 197198 / MUCL 43194) TaxID=747089 RepID=A0A2P4QG48_RHIID|nr:hypothetical protein GLOIN_2v1768727 [Rhizophagus irregularis DAOM 181602=DAOM 197198]POG76607.1 hypothetical protein GLOIN_2v1768727 [Rhizophagus irregularis DAOM 181602=DAOM 197198]|eukprot:XP_025183473.1 hypothetical protein GLOIN_2v1768727 [Rhizophagus irregularis DAOM 181602=DAOM 197198]